MKIYQARLVLDGRKYPLTATAGTEKSASDGVLHRRAQVDPTMKMAVKEFEVTKKTSKA